MAQFTNFQNILPNPSNPISYDGSFDDNSPEQAGFAQGPGYASVKVDSKFKTIKSQTNSGVLVSRSKAYHSFNVSVSYNPLTEDEFNIVYGFLLEKQGMLKPFYIPLPQYDNPKDSTLATANPTFLVDAAGEVGTVFNAGATQITIDAVGYDSATNGQLRPGDMFNINDSSNTNHDKAYKITRVETAQDYTSSAPASNELKISFVPPLRKEVSDNSGFTYKNPLIKVVATDNVSYNLRNDGLYTLSLKTEEVQ
jgi:hypothetical protein